MSSNQFDTPAQPVVDSKRLWAGGAATALVAALIGAVGLLVVRDLLDIPVITSAIEYGSSQLATLIGYGVIAALLATGLLHLLLISTPRAVSFFAWICVLATIVATLWPFTMDATLASQIGSGALYFAMGAAIVSLLSGVAGSATRPRPMTNPGTHPGMY